MQRRAFTVIVLIVLIMAVAVLSGCTEPEALIEDAPTDDAPPEEPRPPAEDAAELVAQLTELRTAIASARAQLQQIPRSLAVEDANAASQDALDVLLADATDPDDDGGLLPSITTERDDESIPIDLLTTTLAIARESRSDLATTTTEFLRDPLAGDLGAWQRDAAGVVGLARDAVDPSDGLAAAELAVLQLDGEATRALAWTFVALRATDIGRAHAAAERADAHLMIIETALDELQQGPAGRGSSASRGPQP